MNKSKSGSAHVYEAHAQKQIMDIEITQIGGH